jgi:predicted metal-dependent HD superfamily phosphohydrolase
MNYRLLSEQVQSHVQSFYKMHNKPALLYHNISHIEYTVSAATQIANHYRFDDRNFFIVITAAWFHDIGYLEDANGHEERSAREAGLYLLSLHVDNDIVEAVKRCILATRMPQQPNGLSEQIICDADLFHLGTDDFAEKNKLLRQEYNATHNVNMSKEEWRAKTIKLLQTHHYHTDYCRILLDAKKEENLEQLKSKQHDKNPVPETETKAIIAPEVLEGKGRKKTDRPDKGVETMFRISSSNHQRLSDMADNKSHILITVNSIIISVVASLLLRKLEMNDYLTIPAIMLLLVSLVTIVLSILATRPNIPEGKFTQEQIDNKNVNLLFFGNFYRMNLDAYKQGMQKVMEDREFLYSTLIRDVYAQGVVLGRKYKYLRAAYNIFMFGLIVSVIAFIIASLMT